MEHEDRSESPGSEALQVFDTHSDRIRYLLRAILSDTEQLNRPIDAAHQMTAHTTATVKNLTKSVSDSPAANNTLALAQISSNLDTLKKSFDEIGAILQANAQVHPFLFDWMLAMMVTFAEAYLENVLLRLTTIHPAWMATNDKLLSGDDVLKIEAALPEERRWQGLMEIMRQRWTERFLRGRPGEWISRLEKFGAPTYRAGLAVEMTTIWNRRHAIVHAPPAARPDQVTGLSGSAAAILAQSKTEFFGAINIIYSFAKATDVFVVDSLNAQRSS